MRLFKFLMFAASGAALIALPVLADEGTSGKPVVTGKDNAVQKIEAASARQMEILTGLLSKVPAQAQADVQKAIDAARQGHDRAIAAITGQEAPADLESADDATGDDTQEPGEEMDGSGEGTQPEVTGLQRARDAVAAGFEKSTATLQGLLDRVPGQAVARIQAALDRLETTRTVTLRNLDGLIAGERPDHPVAHDAADRPDRPARPERPDRPDRPERPQIPDRPDRPVVPDHPGPAHG
jgi:hypothetical protein